MSELLFALALSDERFKMDTGCKSIILQNQFLREINDLNIRFAGTLVFRVRSPTC